MKIVNLAIVRSDAAFDELHDYIGVNMDEFPNALSGSDYGVLRSVAHFDWLTDDHDDDIPAIRDLIEQAKRLEAVYMLVLSELEE